MSQTLANEERKPLLLISRGRGRRWMHDQHDETSKESEELVSGCRTMPHFAFELEKIICESDQNGNLAS